MFDRQLPLLGRRDDLLFPNVLAEDQEQVPRVEFVAKVQILLAAVVVEPLDARVEIDQADGDTGDRDDRQADPLALAADEAALLGVNVERVSEEVDRVEADLFGHADAVGGAPPRLDPRRLDKAGAA